MRRLHPCRIPAARFFRANRLCPAHGLELPTQAGLHKLRAIARTLSLQQVPKTRHDAEGLGQVDVDATSGREWREWVKRLSYDDQALLRTLSVFVQSHTSAMVLAGSTCHTLGHARRQLPTPPPT